MTLPATSINLGKRPVGDNNVYIDASLGPSGNLGINNLKVAYVGSVCVRGRNSGCNNDLPTACTPPYALYGTRLSI